jgi:hypothetical protein
MKKLVRMGAAIVDVNQIHHAIAFKDESGKVNKLRIIFDGDQQPPPEFLILNGTDAQAGFTYLAATLPGVNLQE